MLIYVPLKKNEVILKVYVTFSQLKISLGETFLEDPQARKLIYT